MKDPFDDLRKMLEQVNRIQEQAWKSILPVLDFQKQLSVAIAPTYKQINLLQESLRPLIETMNKLPDVYLTAAKEAAKIPKINLKALSPTLERLSKLSNLSTPVPNEILPKISELCETVEPLVEEVEQIELTDNSDTQTNASDVWTWDRVLLLILTIFQTFFSVFTYTIDQVEADKEPVIQSKQHDEVIEKFNELIEAIQPLIPEHTSEEDQQDLDNPEQ
ncbi:hypothetical protein M3201_18485 [Paenibacillus motobuensis]|uniref:hypothetical protein n=1 Tax=Paenibacillus TaxID=44249 RepID=UPI00203DCFC7|nr:MULTISPECIES: hypothetical protein [Paenibacillus]MCM3041685.1 hypothetical protein [Paenibacillus lutimineralis]MCM3648789.1 hypothetical protein [Paenibacillus motobuensis]